MIPPTSQNPKEFEVLLNIYRLYQPRTVLEIGTHQGGTLYHWLRNATPGTIVGSIDDQGIISEAQAAEWAAESVTARCLRQDSSSKEAIDWAAINIAPIEWLFIDGGHSYKQVKEDWDNYFPFIAEEGIVAFHDICPQENSQVNILWKQLKKEFLTEEIIFPHKDWIIGPGIGVIYL